MSKTKDGHKHASLTHEEQEELIYYLREATSRNLEARFWNKQAEGVEKKVLARLDINPEEYEIDWSGSVEGGKISYKKKEKHVEEKVS